MSEKDKKKKSDDEDELLGFDKINALNIDVEFKTKVVTFYQNLVDLVDDFKLDYSVEKRDDGVLLVIRNMQKITRGDLDILKSTYVKNNTKGYRCKMIKHMTIENGILYFVLKNEDESKIKSTTENNKMEKEEIRRNKKNITANIKKVIFYFNDNDLDLQNEFYLSKYCAKSIKIWETLYSDHSLIQDNTQINVEDNHHEIYINNIMGIIDVPLFFNRITKFNKEHKINDAYLTINSDKSVSIWFDLRDVFEVRNDIYKSEMENDRLTKNKKLI